MRPPYSIILTTTLFGLGQGLFLALYTGEVYSLFKLLPSQDSPYFYGIGCALVLVLLAMGMVASFFHLGHPERAWRAATQWRTSWLSREIIFLPLLMALVVLYGGLHSLGWNPTLLHIGKGLAIDLTVVVGAVATVVCFALYLATGMIYAGVRFLQEWASPLTVINCILLGGASGFTLATAFALNAAPQLVGFYGAWAVIITLLGLCSRFAALWRNGRLKHHSTPRSAIGIRHDRVRQMHQGAMGGCFNTHEYFHGRSDALLRHVKWIFLALGFALPIVLIVVGTTLSAVEWLIAAVVTQYIGLVIERWSFFAEARHPQNLYYQAA